MRVNGGRVGEFFGLVRKKRLEGSSVIKLRTYVKVSIPEAGPDTVASLDFQRWEAISLRD